MAKPRNQLVDVLQYLALRVFQMFAHMFPVETNYRTARLIGDLLFRFDHRHRDRAIRHLTYSFPDWSEERYAHVARLSMRNMAYLGVEFLFTTRLITLWTWRNHIRLTNLAEGIRLALARKQGLVMLTGHFGNWEIVGYALATLGFPTYSVARRLDNPYLDAYAFGVRERTGQVILDKKGASRIVPDLLEQHEVVGFVADQDAGRKGVFVDFFGRKASTYKTIALMAMRYHAPILVGFGRRVGQGFRFEIGIERIIHPEEWADRDDPMLWITQEYTHALENVIRRDPEQYLWVHRRWKHRPRGEQRPADGVA